MTLESDPYNFMSKNKINLFKISGLLYQVCHLTLKLRFFLTICIPVLTMMDSRAKSTDIATQKLICMLF